MSFARTRFATLIDKVNQPSWLGALGFLIIIVLLWLPFGWKTTDIGDGWINLSIVEQGTPINLGGGRPLVYLPWKLGSLITQDSFIGVRFVFAALFWGKAFVVYTLLRKMRLADASLAFLITIVFILHPADQSNFVMRALGRQTGTFFYFLSVLLMVLACQRSNRLYFIGMLIAEGMSALISEQGFVIIMLTPLLMLLCKEGSNRKKAGIAAAWLVVLALCIVNFIGGEKPYQSGLLEGGLKSDPLQFLGDVALSNLVAYRRIFFDGWIKAALALRDFQYRFLFIALVITLLVGCAAWLLNRSKDEERCEENSARYFTILILGGLVMVGASFFPYSLTIKRYSTFHVFYYGAAGAALIMGLIYAQMIRRIPRYKEATNTVLWGLTIFLAAFLGLEQQNALLVQSRGQQQVLLNIVEQAPALKPNVTIVLLADAGKSPFEGSAVFRNALNWTYQALPKQWQALQCAQTENRCEFVENGINGNIQGNKFFVPYENVIFFQYNTKKTALLAQFPKEYQQEGVTYNYQERSFRTCASRRTPRRSTGTVSGRCAAQCRQ